MLKNKKQNQIIQKINKKEKLSKNKIIDKALKKRIITLIVSRDEE